MDFIVSPIVGGLIGGFANWLAIQMLFYPLTEKRIFGIKIPFTPGIVPKERKRIAQSVGNTVSSYFLSEEVIVNAVVSPEMEKQFKKYILEVIEDKKKSEETIGSLIKSLSGRNEEEVISFTAPLVYEFIGSQLKSEQMINYISDIAVSGFAEFGSKKLVDLVTEDKIGYYEEVISKKITDAFEKEDVRNIILDSAVSEFQKFTKSKSKVKELVPNELIKQLKIKIVANSDKIADVIIEYISSSSVQFKIRKVLKNKFEESFKLRMVSKVVDVEKIFENLIEEIVAFLENPEGHKEIGNFAVQWIDGFSEKRVKDIIETYNIDIDKSMIDETLVRTRNSISKKDILKEWISKLRTIYVNDRSLKEILESFDPNIIMNAGSLVRKIIIESIDNICRIYLDNFLRNKLREFLNIKVSKLTQLLSKKHEEIIQNIVIDNFKKLIRGESDRIIKILDVAKIVEDRINAFNVGEMEEIMLGIIKKDIKTMRLFEAGIGFLIGFIIPIYPYAVDYVLKLFK